jgi:hypothetical protein
VVREFFLKDFHLTYNEENKCTRENYMGNPESHRDMLSQVFRHFLSLKYFCWRYATLFDLLCFFVYATGLE